MAIPDPRNDAFLHAEYKALRDEVKGHLDRAWRIEALAVGAIAGFYAIVVEKQIHVSSFVVFAVPLLIVGVAIWRGLATYQAFRQLTQYIKLLEQHFSIFGAPPGWETYWSSGGRRSHVISYLVVSWVFVVLACVAMSWAI